MATVGKVKKPRIESTGFFMQDLAPLIALNPEQGFDEAIEYMKQLEIKIETSPSKDKAKFTEHRRDIMRLMTSTYRYTIIMKITDSKFSKKDKGEVDSLKEKINEASIYCEDDHKTQVEMISTVANYLNLYDCCCNSKEEAFNDGTIDRFDEAYEFAIENNMCVHQITSMYADHLIERIKNGGSKTNIENLWKGENGEKDFKFNEITREKSAIVSLLKLGVSSEQIVKNYADLASVWELPLDKSERDKESIEDVKQKQKRGFNNILRTYKDLLEDRILAYLATDEWKSPKHSLSKDPLIKRFLVEGRSQIFMDNFDECGELVEDKLFFQLISEINSFVIEENKFKNLMKLTLKECSGKGQAEIILKVEDMQVVGQLYRFLHFAKGFEEKMCKILKTVNTDVIRKTFPEDKEKEEQIMFFYDIRECLEKSKFENQFKNVPRDFFEFYGLRP